MPRLIPREKSCVLAASVCPSLEACGRLHVAAHQPPGPTDVINLPTRVLPWLPGPADCRKAHAARSLGAGVPTHVGAHLGQLEDPEGRACSSVLRLTVGVKPTFKNKKSELLLIFKAPVLGALYTVFVISFAPLNR